MVMTRAVLCWMAMPPGFAIKSQTIQHPVYKFKALFSSRTAISFRSKSPWNWRDLSILTSICVMCLLHQGHNTLSEDGSEPSTGASLGTMSGLSKSMGEPLSSEKDCSPTPHFSPGPWCQPDVRGVTLLVSHNGVWPRELRFRRFAGIAASNLSWWRGGDLRLEELLLFISGGSQRGGNSLPILPTRFPASLQG